MLQQDSRTSVGGRMFWSPAMIEKIRMSRERAVELMNNSSGVGHSLTRYS